MDQVKVTQTTLSPPPSSRTSASLGQDGSTPIVKAGNKNDRASKIIELLSEPVVLPQTIDLAVDDIAANVISGIALGTIAVNDHQSALVLFKPVAGNLIT
jgi:hypothetical protein